MTDRSPPLIDLRYDVAGMEEERTKGDLPDCPPLQPRPSAPKADALPS